MCGIVGYIGHRDACEVIMKGLCRLEYRGYDSAGIAMIEPGGIAVRKREGKLSGLAELLEESPLRGHCGIGHTRWATHGEPDTPNSHPHTDCSGHIALVHNGIIENYLSLRMALIEEGHTFTSKTDSEVLVHLVEKYYQGNLLDAVKRAVASAEGAYAIAVISDRTPDEIVVARKASPLVIGVGEGEGFIASDVPAILEYTNRVLYLNDNELARVTRDGIAIYDLSLKPLAREPVTIEWTLEQAEKGGYETFMLKEIYEQPSSFQDVLRGRILPGRDGVTLAMKGIDDAFIRSLEKVSIISCGTACYAGMGGRYLLEHFTDLAVEVDYSSEFRYRCPKLDRNTLVMTVSQSGETADTIASLRMAREKGCKIVSVVNVVGSTIDRESDGVIHTHAGPEIGVASTKAYTAQLGALVLFALHVGRVRGQVTPADARAIIEELESLPGKIDRALATEGAVRSIAQKHFRVKSAFYLGRGFNYPNALEGALKLKEISYLHAEGYPAGEMKHGPNALIDRDFLVVCICTRSVRYDKMISNIKEVEARGGRIVAVGTEGDPNLKDIAGDVIYVPETMEELSPIVNVIPLQLFAYHIARLRGCDIDKPRNLAKSVTVE
ncbi:MAG: glutamine--fructose-6-phosphate transaminase (isomerizing) [Candidatus Aureabacteria bacterium]|nr:glutamine--fructose-6-phosphate transaminase (isomerizing) [Candidatus Auribacterota bacterium]